MSKTRPAPALRVFQILQRYPVIRPRCLPDGPVGSSASRVSAQAARQSMLQCWLVSRGREERFRCWDMMDWTGQEERLGGRARRRD
ncbi:hypothetical protein E5D57_000769 [Metarhizium anisopliae]|nr:hypothetical protein E5D57_000769 [Metarhizium anisopliae]